MEYIESVCMMFFYIELEVDSARTSGRDTKLGYGCEASAQPLSMSKV